MPDGSVHCCVTSPPYFGLRDYKVEGQDGLEKSPEEYVARMVEVFREVRRALRDDGVLWLNLGDSYAGRGKDGSFRPQNADFNPYQANTRRAITPDNCKPKDLIGIPWMLAFALREPYYTGKMRDERDRVWMAAMVDAEGSICGTEYQTGDRTKTNLYITVTNTSTAIIEKCDRIFPQEAKHIYEKKNGASDRVCYRWDVERMDTKALFIREIYPYLVAKRKQAILGYTFLEMQRGLESKKKGYLAAQHEQRSWLMASLAKLNGGDDVDLPSWVIEPPSPTEPGFYLRKDIIWHKPNPMPESVLDRPTSAHEYIFLLSKSPRYFYDAFAVRTQNKDPKDTLRRLYEDHTDQAKTNPDALHNGLRQRTDKQRRHSQRHAGFNDRWDRMEKAEQMSQGANLRDVWSMATEPFKEAHFATFPVELPSKCIKAGTSEHGVCPECGAPWKRIIEKSGGSTGHSWNDHREDGVIGQRAENAAKGGNGYAVKESGWLPGCTHGLNPIPATVLDPFSGAATTGVACLRLGRDYVGIELNPEYIEMSLRRIEKERHKLAHPIAKNKCKMSQADAETDFFALAAVPTTP